MRPASSLRRWHESLVCGLVGNAVSTALDFAFGVVVAVGFTQFVRTRLDTLRDGIRTGGVSVRRLTSKPGTLGAVSGALSFLIGYGLTYLVERPRLDALSEPLVIATWRRSDVAGRYTVGPDDPLPMTREFVTWQYHTLHGASISTDSSWVTNVIPQWPHPLLIPVPAVSLFVGGLFVVWVTGATSRWTAAKRGATVVFGYLPFAVFTAAMSNVTVATDGVVPVTYRITLFEGVLATGLVYPLLFGALGGYFAAKDGRFS